MIRRLLSRLIPKSLRYPGMTDEADLDRACAVYAAAKARYDRAHARGDARGKGEALKALTPALHDVLRAAR